MIRLAVAILVLLASFALLRMLLPASRVNTRQFALIYIGVIAGTILLYFGLTGRLHWLFALIGAALPFVGRIATWFFRALHLGKFASRLRGYSGTGAHSSGPGKGTSALQTRFFDMTLDHASGTMDGIVREGRFSGKHLSALTQDDLLYLLSEVAGDVDSASVLQTYLARHHEEWNAWQDAGPKQTRAGEGLTVRESYEILGLEPGAGREDVVAAHRRLMQRMHPDRGGSDWLAARINEAKATLLGHLPPD